MNSHFNARFVIEASGIRSSLKVTWTSIMALNHTSAPPVGDVTHTALISPDTSRSAAKPERRSVHFAAKHSCPTKMSVNTSRMSTRWERTPSCAVPVVKVSPGEMPWICISASLVCLVKVHLHWEKANAKEHFFFDLCHWSAWTLNWIIYESIWQRSRFPFRANMNEPLVQTRVLNGCSHFVTVKSTFWPSDEILTFPSSIRVIFTKGRWHYSLSSFDYFVPGYFSTTIENGNECWFFRCGIVRVNLWRSVQVMLLIKLTMVIDKFRRTLTPCKISKYLKKQNFKFYFLSIFILLNTQLLKI